MLILAMGFFSVTAILGYNFYRKYNSRLHIHTFSKRYSRIADYQGPPVTLHFDYLQEVGNTYESVNAQVDEIYHYGADYFLKGFLESGKGSCIYKRNRIVNLKIDAKGPELNTFVNLLSIPDPQ